MSHRDRKQAVPAPLPRANAIQGAVASEVLANYLSGTSQAQSASASGTILRVDLTFTPKVTGILRISWVTSGQASAATATVTFSPTVNGTPQFNQDTAPGGDAAHTVTSSGVVTAGGFPVGTPVAVNVAWNATGGTYQTGQFRSRILVEEMIA